MLSLVGLAITTASAQNVRLHGQVSDKTTGDPVIGASVTLETGGFSTATDKYGKFSLIMDTKNPYGSISVSAISYLISKKDFRSGDSLINIFLEGKSVMGREVIISASRVPERILESPVTIEKVNGSAIKDIPGTGFYDALQYLKGVDMNTQSITFRSVSTRGFATDANHRFNQFVDGMDNMVPGLNFAVGKSPAFPTSILKVLSYCRERHLFFMVREALTELC
ncbi:hypothetical protein GCM10023313_32170 [Mucilaginibacter defluvii]|uniref:TonB-dependent receptor plug domain-containing protein n=2 Tax=Mucilaginibacter defluvii TaxID=1196019 RepID=A0ABP9G0T8_9SPHI